MIITNLKKNLKIMLLIFSSRNKKVLLENIFSVRQKIFPNIQHLSSAMKWLCYAQNISSCKGVAGFYSIEKNEWGAAYPETTGYIIPTFLDYYRLTNNEEFLKRAIDMAHWESDIQLKNGAVQSGTVREKNISPAVFNTGQVIFGWTEAYRETKNNNFLNSAIKAGNWLCDIQENDGSWLKGASSLVTNKLNTYNVRCSWALADLYNLTKDKKYFTASRKNALWTLSQQKENGWFNNNDFSDNSQPFLHTIAYAIEGLLETGICLKEEIFINMAQKAADILLEKQNEDGFLYARYDKNWMPTVKYFCLTGNAQMAVIWFKLYQLNKENKYISAAKNVNDLIKSTQNIQTNDENIYGAIMGSYPIWGGYETWHYLNWATKFFADSLIFEEKLSRSIYIS